MIHDWLLRRTGPRTAAVLATLAYAALALLVLFCWDAPPAALAYLHG